MHYTFILFCAIVLSFKRSSYSAVIAKNLLCCVIHFLCRISFTVNNKHNKTHVRAVATPGFGERGVTGVTGLLS